jgi:chromate transporter
MFVAIGVLSLYFELARFHATNIILTGVGAAALGVSLQMGARVAWLAASSIVPVVILVVTFVAIFAFRLPLLLVLSVMAPISITAAFYRLRNNTSQNGR